MTAKAKGKPDANSGHADEARMRLDCVVETSDGVNITHKTEGDYLRFAGLRY